MLKRSASVKAGNLADDFRRIALSMQEAVEGAHMGHADFRVRGKIFATLNHDETRGVVMLDPGEQREFVQANPSVFFPVNGAWGAKGATHVELSQADEDVMHPAVSVAWRRAMAKLASTPRKGRPRAK